MLGLLKYEGHVLIDDKELKDLKPKQRASLVAYVPQSAAFAPSTVYDAVMLGRVPHFAFAPSKEDHDVVRSTLCEMGLEPLADRNVLDLSGGEKQKVAIARALAQEASILVFDEPTSNLDIAAETMVAEMVRDLSKKKGLTVLLSMHDLNLALEVGDRFVLLKDGRLVAFGDKAVLNEENVETAFGVKAKRVQIDDKDFIIHGGKET